MISKSLCFLTTSELLTIILQLYQNTIRSLRSYCLACKKAMGLLVYVKISTEMKSEKKHTKNYNIVSIYFFKCCLNIASQSSLPYKNLYSRTVHFAIYEG